MTGIAGEIVEDLHVLERLAPEWWDLWRRSPSALPFNAPAWLIPWWRAFAPGALFTLVAREDGRLVGLAPGYLEDGPLGRRILPLGISLSDHLDILIDPGAAHAAMAALAAAAAARVDRWDVWELEELPPHAAALNLSLPPHWADHVQPQTACPVLFLPQPGDRRPLFPSGKRRHLNLARNRAARRGEVVIERADARSAPAALEHLLRLHGKRWDSRGGAGMLAPDAVRRFQRNAVPALQAAGLLRLTLLKIAEQVVAAQYELIGDAQTSVYLTGFDPDYAYESPSVILLADGIEQAAAEGRREVDFLRGQEAYKYEWGAIDRWNLKRSIRHAANG